MIAVQAAVRRKPPARLIFLVVVPLAYAGLLLFHPIPGDGAIDHALAHDLATWNLVHVAQLGFIGAMGGAVLWLVQGIAGPAAGIARVAAIVFVLVYGAYETWTGVVTGALTAAAHDLPAGDQAAAGTLIQAHWESSLLGNGSIGAITGSTAWLVAVTAAALALRGRGAPTGAVIALIASGVVFAPTHVPPGGPMAMALFAVAVIWWERSRRADPDRARIEERRHAAA
jgi:hypothetical protein